MVSEILLRLSVAQQDLSPSMELKKKVKKKKLRKSRTKKIQRKSTIQLPKRYAISSPTTPKPMKLSFSEADAIQKQPKISKVITSCNKAIQTLDQPLSSNKTEEPRENVVTPRQKSEDLSAFQSEKRKLGKEQQKPLKKNEKVVTTTQEPKSNSSSLKNSLDVKKSATKQIEKTKLTKPKQTPQESNSIKPITIQVPSPQKKSEPEEEEEIIEDDFEQYSETEENSPQKLQSPTKSIKHSPSSKQLDKPAGAAGTTQANQELVSSKPQNEPNKSSEEIMEEPVESTLDDDQQNEEVVDDVIPPPVVDDVIPPPQTKDEPIGEATKDYQQLIDKLNAENTGTFPKTTVSIESTQRTSQQENPIQLPVQPIISVSVAKPPQDTPKDQSDKLIENAKESPQIEVHTGETDSESEDEPIPSPDYSVKPKKRITLSIIFHDGTRKIKTFTTGQSVSDIREYVEKFKPLPPNSQFDLLGPNNAVLSDETQSVELYANSVIKQKLK